MELPFGAAVTGGAWLSSARVVMLGSVPQRAQPLSLVASISDGHSSETAGESRRKVGMDHLLSKELSHEQT
jgi:hypothetical protein